MLTLELDRFTISMVTTTYFRLNSKRNNLFKVTLQGRIMVLRLRVSLPNARVHGQNLASVTSLGATPKFLSPFGTHQII